MKLDSSDVAILEVLLRDGRASFREIAARTSLTTPTVSLRISRMKKGGLIKGFEPLIDTTASQALALIKLKVPENNVTKVAANLASLEEVKGVFITAGKGNITMLVSADDRESAMKFITRKLKMHFAGKVVSMAAVTEVVKDAPVSNLREGIEFKLRCDQCHKEILSDRPYNVRSGSAYSCFCSRSCRKSFLDERGSPVRGSPHLSPAAVPP